MTNFWRPCSMKYAVHVWISTVQNVTYIASSRINSTLNLSQTSLIIVINKLNTTVGFLCMYMWELEIPVCVMIHLHHSNCKITVKMEKCRSLISQGTNSLKSNFITDYTSSSMCCHKVEKLQQVDMTCINQFNFNTQFLKFLVKRIIN